MLLSDRTVDGTKISDLTHASEKRIAYRCDGCGREGERSWANHQKAISRWGKKTYCRRCASKRTGKERRGTEAWNKGVAGPRGERSSSWKGGSYIDAHGYRMVYRRGDGAKPAVGWESYSKEHVLVMEEAIGRSLEKGETVHHLDGEKLNNLLHNLFLTNHQGHRLAHQSLQEIGYVLFKAGLVRFDRKSGRYVAHRKLRELLGHPGEGNQQPRRSRKGS